MSVFDKLNACFSYPPTASGPNVFTTADYADAVGIQCRSARDRIGVLVRDGKVRPVRTKRAGRTVSAWEYIAKSTKKATND